MRNIYFAIICCLIATGCKKQTELPKPVSEFYLGDPSLSSYVVPEATVIIPLNNSGDGVSYFWDFGNGTTSKEKTPSIYFDQGGKYTISLTVTNSDGASSTTKREVQVLMPVIHKITIRNLNEWTGANFSTLKKFKGGDVWVEIYKSNNTTSYTQLSNGAYNYPLYYKSSVYKNASIDNSAPIVIDVPEEVNLSGKLSSDTFRYVFCLFVKDAQGTHMLFSSDFGASSFIPTTDGPDFLDWTSGFQNTSVAITCKYQ